MTTYLLIETRTTWESEQVKGFLELAQSLADQKQTIHMFLIQNAVLMAYAEKESRIQQLLQYPNVVVWADDFSLESRALSQKLIDGVQIGDANDLVRLLTEDDCKPIWH